MAAPPARQSLFKQRRDAASAASAAPVAPEPASMPVLGRVVERTPQAPQPPPGAPLPGEGFPVAFHRETLVPAQSAVHVSAGDAAFESTARRLISVHESAQARTHAVDSNRSDVAATVNPSSIPVVARGEFGPLSSLLAPPSAPHDTVDALAAAAQLTREGLVEVAAANARAVEGMTDEERDAALAEVSMMLPDALIQAMRRRAQAQPQMHSQNTDVDSKVPAPRASPAELSALMSAARTHEELLSLARTHLPESEQRKLAWMGDDVRAGTEIHSTSEQDTAEGTDRVGTMQVHEQFGELMRVAVAVAARAERRDGAMHEARAGDDADVADQLQAADPLDMPAEVGGLDEHGLHPTCRRMRFDFHARLLHDGTHATREGATEHDTAMFHHGDDPDVAGYCLAELLGLVRSSIAAQRQTALTTVARILRRRREAFISTSSDEFIPLRELVLPPVLPILLRASLDDRVPSVLSAALDALDAFVVARDALLSTLLHDNPVRERMSWLQLASSQLTTHPSRPQPPALCELISSRSLLHGPEAFYEVQQHSTQVGESAGSTLRDAFDGMKCPALVMSQRMQLLPRLCDVVADIVTACVSRQPSVRPDALDALPHVLRILLACASVSRSVALSLAREHEVVLPAVVCSSLFGMPPPASAGSLLRMPLLSVLVQLGLHAVRRWPQPSETRPGTDVQCLTLELLLSTVAASRELCRDFCEAEGGLTTSHLLNRSAPAAAATTVRLGDVLQYLVRCMPCTVEGAWSADQSRAFLVWRMLHCALQYGMGVDAFTTMWPVVSAAVRTCISGSTSDGVYEVDGLLARAALAALAKACRVCASEVLGGNGIAAALRRRLAVRAPVHEGALLDDYGEMTRPAIELESIPGQTELNVANEQDDAATQSAVRFSMAMAGFVTDLVNNWDGLRCCSVLSVLASYFSSVPVFSSLPPTFVHSASLPATTAATNTSDADIMVPPLHVVHRHAAPVTPVVEKMLRAVLQLVMTALPDSTSSTIMLQLTSCILCASSLVALCPELVLSNIAALRSMTLRASMLSSALMTELASLPSASALENGTAYALSMHKVAATTRVPLPWHCSDDRWQHKSNVAALTALQYAIDMVSKAGLPTEMEEHITKLAAVILPRCAAGDEAVFWFWVSRLQRQHALTTPLSYVTGTCVFPLVLQHSLPRPHSSCSAWIMNACLAGVDVGCDVALGHAVAAACGDDSGALPSAATAGFDPLLVSYTCVDVSAHVLHRRSLDVGVWWERLPAPLRSSQGLPFAEQCFASSVVASILQSGGLEALHPAAQPIAFATDTFGVPSRSEYPIGDACAAALECACWYSNLLSANAAISRAQDAASATAEMETMFLMLHAPLVSGLLDAWPKYARSFDTLCRGLLRGSPDCLQSPLATLLQYPRYGFGVVKGLVTEVLSIYASADVHRDSALLPVVFTLQHLYDAVDDVDTDKLASDVWHQLAETGLVARMSLPDTCAVQSSWLSSAQNVSGIMSAHPLAAPVVVRQSLSPGVLDSIVELLSGLRHVPDNPRCCIAALAFAAVTRAATSDFEARERLAVVHATWPVDVQQWAASLFA